MYGIISVKDQILSYIMEGFIMEKKLKHLELVQGVITRMAGNSFMLKGWAVTLAAAIFALSAKDAEKSYFIVAYIPIIVFWLLDSYYLQQERLYRSLYDKVRETDESQIDFSLKAVYNDFPKKTNTFANCAFSKTEIGFYLPLALVCLVIVLITSAK